MDRRENKWQVDKHIPIAIILGMLAQTAFAVWYVATFTAITNQRLISLEHFQNNTSEISRQIPERITKLETQQVYTNSMLTEILSEIRNDRRK